jgi:dTDP-L-rhamnose 4-epimerase
MAKVMGKSHIVPEVSGKYRVGDIRHCMADIRLARRMLGYEPRVGFEQGLQELAEWLGGQVAVDRVEAMRSELDSRGLSI